MNACARATPMPAPAHLVHRTRETRRPRACASRATATGTEPCSKNPKRRSAAGRTTAVMALTVRRPRGAPGPAPGPAARAAMGRTRSAAGIAECEQRGDHEHRCEREQASSTRGVPSRGSRSAASTDRPRMRRSSIPGPGAPGSESRAANPATQQMREKTFMDLVALGKSLWSGGGGASKSSG